jgi:hypothetical protein
MFHIYHDIALVKIITLNLLLIFSLTLESSSSWYQAFPAFMDQLMRFRGTTAALREVN